jgi:hypothetical protein
MVGPEALGGAMAAGFWPDAEGWWITGGSFAVGVVVAVVGRHATASPDLPGGSSAGLVRTYAASERDRLQGIAKGEGAAASAFLLAILTALVEHRISARLPAFYLLCCVAGILGLLMLAAFQSGESARRFVAIRTGQDG